MCKKQMGPRCSAAAKQSRQIVRKRLEKKQEEVNAYELKIADSLEKRPDELNGRDLIQLSKHERLHDELTHIRNDYKEAEINFYATPAGDKELEGRLAEARERGDEFVEKQLLTLQSEAAELHSWQLAQLRHYKQLEEQKTPEEVLEEVEKDLATVDQEHAEAQEKINELVEEIRTQIPEADEEKVQDFVNNVINDEQIVHEKDLENLIKNPEKNPEEDSQEEGTLSEEELEELRIQRRKQIRQLTALAALAVGILAASYIMQKSTGKRSQILGYAKGFVTRNAMTSGKKYLTKQSSILGLPFAAAPDPKTKNPTQKETEEVHDVVRDEKIMDQNTKENHKEQDKNNKTNSGIINDNSHSPAGEYDDNWHEQPEPSYA